MKFFRVFIFYFLIAMSNFLDGITLVYNMRIRRAFGLSNIIEDGKDESHVLLSVVPIVYTRDRHIVDDTLKLDICEKRISGGALLNARYIPSQKWWLEATTGIEKEHVKSEGTSCIRASRTGFDDIIISGGRNFFLTDNMQFVLYGIGGIPTKRSVGPDEAQDTLVGTRLFSVGLGAEISQAFINSLKRSLTGIFQVRFIHFFNRRWYPILPCDAKIQPGNVTDLLFTVQYRERKNVFEVGYNPTIFTNQAVLLKTGPIRSDTAVRQAVYGSYGRLFRQLPLTHHPGFLGAGISIARAKRFDTKIFTGWLNVSVLF